MASSGMCPGRIKEKPVVVRVKRKSSQASLDAFWLEINARPHKRPFMGFEDLSISGHENKVSGTSKTKRILVQHVETVSPSEAIEDVLQSLLPNYAGSEDLNWKIEARKGHFKQFKKQQLRSVAKREHEELARNARLEQIWRSRRGEIDSLREFCHLYDVVRVDTEDEKPIKELQYVSAEDNAILCNYLPLLREYIPSAAEEMEPEIQAYLSRGDSDSMTTVTKEDGYVYDLYTVEEFTGDEDASCDYPSVQVKDEEDYDDTPASECGSEDSNAEDHPRNDYPDEESSNREDDEDDPFGDLECSDSDHEEELSSSSRKDEGACNSGDEGVLISSSSESSESDHEDEDSFRWGYR